MDNLLPADTRPIAGRSTVDVAYRDLAEGIAGVMEIFQEQRMGRSHLARPYRHVSLVRYILDLHVPTY